MIILPLLPQYHLPSLEGEEGVQDFLHARQAWYPLNYVPSHHSGLWETKSVLKDKV